MNYENFKWSTESSCEQIENGIQMYAPQKSDYFANPIQNEIITTAPFYYQEVSGDFVLRARVSHDFLYTYDACSLLALQHETLWAKACFEYSDFDTHAIVSVMTNQFSDDANGVEIAGNEVWLQLARKGNMFAVHFSLDGEHFQMARLTYLPMEESIKVGFEAQSPVGNGGMRYFKDIVFVQESLENIRDGRLLKDCTVR